MHSLFLLREFRISWRRFLRLMAVGDQPGDEADRQVGEATMTRMLDLADVFEQIIDCFNERKG
jgi:hypothetical protein